MQKIFIASGKVAKPKSLRHGSGHYGLALVKYVAKRNSASANVASSNVDSMAVAGFMPVGAKPRVLSWPEL